MSLADYAKQISRLSESGRITRVAVFDFDGTLFASPEKPEWWPHRGFWGRLETLSPPLVPENPDMSWWAPKVVAQAKDAIKDSRTYVVLLTGRVEKFAPRIKHMLKSVGLDFDDHFFGDGSSTMTFKLGVLGRLAARFPDASIEMWEDRPEHVPSFENFLTKLGRDHVVHKVHVDPPPFEEDGY